ncbi:response regulator transcription factor [Gracilibacillus kekensis]|uniref:Two-component system, response regulator YesN n=1 Tax=Gracilibacillus kekensis TaxID=1027249 RepID=A0A1M7QSN5_9BACI|nr:response regulator [Gracilibacillus kekensis]SHN34682.1 two-component system, response regulator YesN [Gracilibacillus kekensis]
MKVLIVDDEVIIREGICNVVPWRDYGFEILNPASSAEEAMDVIDNIMPDIILTDIQMNGKNGLELASYIYEKKLPIEVIVLTGYDEFSYAQEALRQGVSDYLLKTSLPEDILKAVEKSREKVLYAKDQFQINQNEKQRIITHSMTNFIKGIGTEEAMDSIKELIPELKDSMIQILVLDTQLKSVHLAEHEQLWNKYLYGKWVSLNEKTVIIVKRDPCLDDDYLLQMASSKVYQSLCEPLFVGTIVSHLTDLSLSYEKAVSLILYKWLLTDCKMIGENHIKHRIGLSNSEFLKEYEEKLFSYLNKNNAKGLRNWLVQVIERQVTHPQATPESIHLNVQSLFIHMIHFVNKVALSVGKKTMNYHSFPTISNWLPTPKESVIPAFMEVMGDYQRIVDREVNFVHIAIHYMENNLGKTLTLLEVAEHVHVHPNYLSEMLRKETGKSYVEFLTALRIEKAKQLLRYTPAKVKDISSEVGYSDWKYFTSQFKKYIRLTPTQYRDRQEEDA